jgi:uncharacterized protein (TIGR02145 family)
MIRSFTNFRLLAILLTSCIWVHGFSQYDQKKFALVIGIRSYQFVPPLQNSVNDATDMAAILKQKGFQVIELYDPQTKRELRDAIRKYFDQLVNEKNVIGLLYYSGHGMQVDGTNYLIPTQANPQIKADLEDQCLNMDYVMQAIEQAGNTLNIFILDACRNNPFRSFSRSGEKGLSMINTPKGSYIVYATKPGSVASDGIGRNGLFTSKLLQYINSRGLNIEQVFKRVAADVALESNDTQRPWIASDYTGDFFFTPQGNVQNQIQPAASPNTIQQNTIDKSTDILLSEYVTVAIGKMKWMSRNLDVSTFSNGESIPQARTAEEWKAYGEKRLAAWCYYEFDEENGGNYGKLYNWYAVNDKRGLAPKGFHIASDKEWNELVAVLGGSKKAGHEMKHTEGWNQGGNGNNSSNFAALPGGYCLDDGTFGDKGNYGVWWSASADSDTNALNRIIQYSSEEIYRDTPRKSEGQSVRCVANQ